MGLLAAVKSKDKMRQQTNGRTTNIDYIMPTVTRTVAKGIPPRLRSSATKGRSNKKVGKEKGLGVSKKRKATTDSEDESSDSGDSSDSPGPKTKKRTKRQRKVNISSDEEIELVDNAGKPPPVIEEVDDMDNGPVSAETDIVSKKFKLAVLSIYLHQI